MCDRSGSETGGKGGPLADGFTAPSVVGIGGSSGAFPQLLASAPHTHPTATDLWSADRVLTGWHISQLVAALRIGDRVIRVRRHDDPRGLRGVTGVAADLQ